MTNRWSSRGLTYLLGILAIGACGSDGTGSSGLTSDDITGVWDLNSTGCLNGTLPVRLNASNDGSLTSAVNAWTNDPAGTDFTRPLDGSVDLGDGAAEFHMFASGARTSAILFTGTIEANHTLTGTLSDPMPGYTPIFHFSGDPTCTGQVTGSRR